MPVPVYMVKVGMTMTEGMVEEWCIPDQGTVQTGELLYRLETEKVNLDVEAEAPGTVLHVVPAGLNVEPGTVVAYIFAADETVALPADVTPLVSAEAAPAAAAAPTAPPPAATAPVATPAAPPPIAASAAPAGRVKASPAARRLAGELGVDYRVLQGSGPGGRIVEADIQGAATAGAAAHPAQAAGPAPKSSPLARRLAAERGIDLRTIRGTGPGGRIVRDDVENAPVPAAPLVPGPVPGSVLVADTIALKGMRKVIAERMHASLQHTAQLTMDMDIAMDECVKLRAQLIDEWAADGVRPSYTDIVVRAVAKALTHHPLMNAQLVGDHIALLDTVHVGIAVAVPDGLLVPVLRDADRRSLRDISIEAGRLAGATRDGTLGLDDYSGGTFTVSALGMYGVDSFTPIINEPQAGILGINRLRDDVAFDGDTPRKARFMRLSLTWDHRVLDGAPAAEFLGEVRDLLQAPYRLLV